MQKKTQIQMAKKQSEKIIKKNNQNKKIKTNNIKKTICIGADHAGYTLKEHIKKFLRKKKFTVKDYGALTFDKNDDYPDYAEKVAENVAKNKTKGILLCGTGIGVSITANKFKNIRAALVIDEKTAKLSKQHNHSNILCLSSWTTKPKKAEKIINTWLKTKPLTKKRHIRRIKKIKNLEK